jgi:sarcosine oxidase
MTDIFDCIVVGLGGHGSAILGQLAEKGKNVLGIEKYGRVHAHGSSHGRSRIIRQAYYEDHRYVPMLKRSLQLWQTLDQKFKEKHSDSYLLKMTGGLMIGLPDSEVILGTMASVKEHDLKHEILTSEEIRNKFPAFNVSSREIGKSIYNIIYIHTFIYISIHNYTFMHMYMYMHIHIYV